MEKIQISEDVEVILETPECTLKYAGCGGSGSFAIRVHGCNLHIACANCKERFDSMVRKNYRCFTQMRCRNCKIDFTSDKYFEVIVL